MIKTIETVYNGYRFRSRLEARWAVFFDALGIKYEYEAEGYDLGEEGWYLPDFYFPEGLLDEDVKFAEVKKYQGKNSFSVKMLFPKVHAFAVMAIKELGYKTALLDGPPDFTYYYVCHYDADLSEPDNPYGDGWGEDAMLFNEAMDENRWFVFSGCWRDDIEENDFFAHRYKLAVYEARKARF